MLLGICTAVVVGIVDVVACVGRFGDYFKYV